LTLAANPTLQELAAHLVDLYKDVKSYVIQSEKLSEGRRTSTPALNELRHAFDHWMRVEAVWRHGRPVPEGAEPDGAKYCEKNLRKTIGHVYRAGYDALDIMALHKLRQVDVYQTSFRLSARLQVITDYAERVRMPLEKAVATCNKAKLGKDVESERVEEHVGFFRMYHEAIEDLDAVLKVLEDHEQLLHDAERELARNDRRVRNYALAAMAVSILVAVAAILHNVLTK